MTAPTIDDLPTPPPSRADPTNFAARGDATLGALPTLITQINVVVAWIVDALAQILAAAASVVSSPNTQATSTSNLSVSIALKTLNIEASKSIVEDMWVAIVDQTNPSRWMAGPVSSYDAGTGQLIVDSQRVAGTGSSTSWRVYGISPMLPDSAPRALGIGSTVKDSAGTDRAIGFLDSPPVSITTAHVLTPADNGKTLELGVGGSITVPLHSTADMGNAIVLIRNMTSSTKSITPAAGVTMHWSGSTSAGARSLKAWGDAAITFTSVNDDVRVKGDLT